MKSPDGTKDYMSKHIKKAVTKKKSIRKHSGLCYVLEILWRRVPKVLCYIIG